ncbi:MAG: hypothetical protein QM758_05095 [Armatimonas sp.]
MTPEQNKQWKQAILGDGSESPYEHWKALYAVAALLPEPIGFLQKAWRESEERLAGWGVPGWARECRTRCAYQSWEDSAHDSGWVPEFALRSETALLGLQLLYPSERAQFDAYQRVLLRFVHKVLEPFVLWVLEQNRSGYQHEIDVYEQYARLIAEPSLLQVENTDWMLYLFDLHDDAMRQIWSGSQFVDLKFFFLKLTDRYRLCTKETSDNYTDLIAQAYLAALEAECPPPDWLPEP